MRRGASEEERGRERREKKRESEKGCKRGGEREGERERVGGSERERKVSMCEKEIVGERNSLYTFILYCSSVCLF